MIFEDGDLDAEGGEGRAQNFRWKNIDAVADDDSKEAGDDDDDDEVHVVQTMEDTETRRQWRKQQYERDQWIKEQSKSKEVRSFDLLEASAITKTTTTTVLIPRSF